MKKIAILGDPNSIWIKTYVKEVFADLENQYDIFIFTDKNNNPDNGDWDFEFCHIIECTPGSVWNKIHLGTFVYIMKIFANLKKLKNIDYFHVHFVNKRKLLALKLFKRFFKKSIITFWGSDLLRKNERELEQFGSYMEHVDTVTVGSDQMQSFFTSKFNTALNKKLAVKRFGVNALPAIINNREPKAEIKKRSDIPNEKIVITIGYNGSKGQNHLEVFSSLENLKKEIRDKIFLVIPMTYGSEPDYYHMVEERLLSLGCSFKILTEYMSVTEIAFLCSITDIFIHAQKTDAFSASIQEYLCAGKLLLNPNWIVYNELKDHNVYYLEYSNYSEISELVNNYVLNGLTVEEQEMLQQNKELVYRLSSWDNLKEEWIKLYS